MRKGGEEAGERAAIGAIKMEKRGIDGVGCPPLLLRWNFSGQAQPVTRDNPAANELKSRRGFLLAQGELVCKPRNSPRSVRVSMIFTVPRPSSSSSRFYSPSLVFPALGRRSMLDDTPRRGKFESVGRARICVTIADGWIVDPIFGENSIPINIARGDEVEK